ncbi:MAG: ferrous iron transport protein A [Candidatus Aenigmarchaeota archaeon]|nr:ferrous iron transport protein A [Candidatus Aenigmarchaeota archaeon]
MSLAMAECGKKVLIKEIASGVCLRKRLSDLGIYEGVKVEVVRNDFSGPVIVSVLDSKVILGRGEVHKIMVE